MSEITVNDGGGLFDKYGMIQNAIDQLNTLQVSGYQNMATLINVAQQLTALKQGMKDEEERLARERQEAMEEI